MQPHELLEKRIGEWLLLDPQCVVACSSGTAALHLAFESLRLPAGSQVVVPDYAMIACARAVSMSGLEPIFVNCLYDLNIDPDLCGSIVRRHSASAILVVHTYGRRCDMDTISRPYGDDPACPPIIEDMAELHGVKPYFLSTAACWSFYKNKVVAGEEGGAVWFRDVEHAKVARSLRCLGFTEAHDYWHAPRGHNYRLAPSLAQKILESLAQYEDNRRRRCQIEQWYDFYCPDEWKIPGTRQVPWVYDFILPPGKPRDKVVKVLNGIGIAARQGFKPLSLQPEYRDRGLRVGMFAKDRGERVAYLPICPGETTKEVCRRAFEEVRWQVGEGGA